MCNDFDKNAMSLFADRFGQLVEQKKKNEKISMEKLAHELDISKPTLYRWMNGEAMPNNVSFSMICSYFGVPKNYFDPPQNDKIFFDKDFHKTQHENAFLIAKYYELSIPFIAFLKDIPALADAVISASYVDASENSFSESVPETDSPFQFVSSSGVKIYLPMETLYALKDIQADIVDYAQYAIHKRMKDIETLYKRMRVDSELDKVLDEIIKTHPDIVEQDLFRQGMAASFDIYCLNKGKVPFPDIHSRIYDNIKSALASSNTDGEPVIIQIQSADCSVRILKNTGLKETRIILVNG